MSRGSRGAASPLLVAVALCGFLSAAGAARLGGALVARARADTAADAAALAAADALATGRGRLDAVAAARERAAANGARLVSCRCADGAAEVTVEVGGGAIGRPVRSQARAEVGAGCGGAPCPYHDRFPDGGTPGGTSRWSGAGSR